MSAISENMMVLGTRGLAEKQQVDIRPLVEQALAQMPDRPVTLSVESDLDRASGVVDGSPYLLGKALSNLMAHARSAMKDAGLLSIRLERVLVEESIGCHALIPPGQYVRLSISNSGTDLPIQVREGLLEGFTPTSLSGERYGGVIGLSVARAVAESHGGYLDLVPQRDGGTLFLLYLPTLRDVGRNDQSTEGTA